MATSALMRARPVVRAVALLSTCFLLCAAGCAHVAPPPREPVITSPIRPPPPPPPEPPPPEPPPKTLTLLFAGDIAFPQAADRRARWGPAWKDADPYTHFEATRAQIAAADLAIGNIEMVIADGYHKRTLGLDFAFKGLSSLAQVLADVGFDAMTMANNHVLDFGVQAFTQTRGHLENARVATFGSGADLASARRPLIVTLHNTRLAFLGYSIRYRANYTATPSGPGVAPFKSYDRKALKRAKPFNYETFIDTLQDLRPSEEAFFVQDIEALKGQVDHIILFLHWGTEKQVVPSPYQRQVAHMAIDAGASLVVGAGPHVVQEFEVYKGCFIEYSLGNHLFASMGTSEGIFLEVDLAGPRLLEARRYPLDVDNTDDTPFHPRVTSEPSRHLPTDAPLE